MPINRWKARKMDAWRTARDLIAHAQVPDSLPDPDELRGRVRSLAASFKEIRVEEIGASRLGRPIEYVEIGEGLRSALLVGAPHPNEPIGCSSILTMIEVLANAPDLVAELGYRWCFIPCIEPDGLALNRGWLKGPRTPEHYLEHFYRPAFDQQAEYTFPLEVGEWRFDRPTPENLAFQSALAKAKPDLLASLHNAEFGSAFYILSKDLPGLADFLASETKGAGLYLDDEGDPGLDSPRIRPGVFQFTNLGDRIREAIEAGEEPSNTWPAGNSSESYARTRFGTMSLVQEFPYWDDDRLRNHSPSPFHVSDVVPEIGACKSQALALLDRRLDGLIAASRPEFAPFVSALREAHTRGRASGKEMAPPSDRLLSVAEHTMLSVSTPLFALRPVAMLKRLADGLNATEASDDAHNIIATQLAKLRVSTQFDIIPIQKLVRLQLSGILAGAEVVERVAG